MCPKTPIIHFRHFCHHLELKKEFKLISTNTIDMTITKKIRYLRRINVKKVRKFFIFKKPQRFVSYLSFWRPVTKLLLIKCTGNYIISYFANLNLIHKRHRITVAI